MFDVLSLREADPSPAGDDDAALPACWRVLDEIDYGLLMLDSMGTVQHVNHMGRHELSLERCLVSVDSVLTGLTARHREELTRGLSAARAGRREMLRFELSDDPARALTAVCVPLGSPFDGEAPPVLLMLERNRDENLALSLYARHHGITPAEQSVLRGLCEGLDVAGIALRLHIAESTVRTHVRSLREKTRTTSMRQLVQTVGDLPPMVSALRQGGASAWPAGRYTAAARACPKFPSPITFASLPAGASSGTSAPACC